MPYETLPYPEQAAMKWFKEHGGLAHYGKSGMNAIGVINSRTKPKTWLSLIQKGYIIAQPIAEQFEITKKR